MSVNDATAAEIAAVAGPVASFPVRGMALWTTRVARCILAAIPFVH